MRQELKDAIYTKILEFPAASDYVIADKLKGVSRSTVYRARNKLVKAIDYELAKQVAGKFLVDFQMASDYFKLQIERLEKLKEKTKIIQRNNVTTGKVESNEVPLDPIDILAIEKQQSELWKNILFLARQGEAIEVMRIMGNGRFSKVTDASQ